LISARKIDVRNPRSGQFDYSFVTPSTDSLSQMLKLLRSNQREWVDKGLEKRIAVLQQWIVALDTHKTKIVAALAEDTGRQALALREFDGFIASIEHWCALAPMLMGHSSQQSQTMPDVEIYSDTEPYPVLAVISPWNFPLLLSFIDTVPALLAGCAVFIKPSEVTPRFVEPINQSIAAVPELNEILIIAAGDGTTGQALITEVDVVSFTGSIATGKKVALAAAAQFIPAFLELGGKDPAIILPGSDLNRAARSILRASVSATGQACQSLERIYIHHGDAEKFITVLLELAKDVKLSKEDSTKGAIGPLIFAKQAEIISDHIADALAKGAVLEYGGEVIEDDGAFWIAPTIMSDVDHSMKIMTEETFGPIMPVMTYDSVAHALKLANDTDYGLSAAVFGPDEKFAIEFARKVNAGGVSINDAGLTAMLFETEKTTFGYSGMGPSRVGASSLTRFLRQKSLYVNRGEVLLISAFNEQA